MMGRPSRYPPELLERAARLVTESGLSISQVAADLGVGRESLRLYIRRQQAAGESALVSSSEREELRRLRRENAELRRANAILREASAYFATELDPTRRR